MVTISYGFVNCADEPCCRVLLLLKTSGSGARITLHLQFVRRGGRGQSL